MQDHPHARHGARSAAALVAALASLLVLAGPARASGPENDDFDSARAIAGQSGQIEGDSSGATTQPLEPAHGGSGGASLWYRWTSPFTGRVIFDTCEGLTFDTLLALYSGTTLTGLQRLAANDDDCDLGSRVVAAVTEGTVYHVAVDGYDGESGRFTLRWRPFPAEGAPVNDAFASARVISGMRGRLVGTTVGATGEQGEPGSMNGSSVWYRWRAPRTMLISFRTCGASFDTVLGVYQGPTVRSLRQLVWNDDACGLSSRITLAARAGLVYHVGVGALGEPGTFELRWQPAPCRVPSLRGRMLAQARTMLTRSGCALGLVRYVPSTIAPRGAVVAQWPAPGTQLAHLGRVRVAVSSGRPR